MSASRCTCPWQVVEIHPDVESLVLRADTDPDCRFPHAGSREPASDV